MTSPHTRTPIAPTGRPGEPDPAPAAQRRLYSMRELADLPQYRGVITEPGLRWWRFDAVRPSSPYAGFRRCCVRLGRRVLIDLPEFERWLAERRQG